MNLLTWLKNNSIGVSSGVYCGKNIHEHFFSFKTVLLSQINVLESCPISSKYCILQCLYSLSYFQSIFNVFNKWIGVYGSFSDTTNTYSVWSYCTYNTYGSPKDHIWNAWWRTFQASWVVCFSLSWKGRLIYIY